MINKPFFVSDSQYKSYLTNINFWQSIVTGVLKRHHLYDKSSDISAGFNSTYPVFLTGDVVVKFFGYRAGWQETFRSECAAYQCLATDAAICVPKIIATGQLFEESRMSWPYVISTQMTGHSWQNSQLTTEQKHKIAAQLGEQLRHIHALPVNDLLNEGALHTDQSWGSLNIKAAAEQSSLPKHLIEQIDPFIAKLDPFDRVFVNGDIVAMHVFVDHGDLSGIIDWGDAVVTDRHYEVGKLCNSLFPGDKELLKVLLDASAWPMTHNFPMQTLGMALYRQAVGLTQHHTFDIFYKLSDNLPINEAKSLDELARLLYEV